MDEPQVSRELLKVVKTIIAEEAPPKDGWHTERSGDWEYDKHYQNGKLHRDDGPAWIEKNKGNVLGKEWYRNGQLHRDGDEPAVSYGTGVKKWCKHGKLHRDNGLPAVIYSDSPHYPDHGEWWVDGKRHRGKDMPAVVGIDKKEWWVNGQRHRDSGPARITHRVKSWYDHGQRIKTIKHYQGRQALISEPDAE